MTTGCFITARRIALGAFGVIAGVASPAAAEMFMIGDCDGTTGIAVVGYSKTVESTVQTTTELSEVCWSEADMSFRTANVASDALEFRYEDAGAKNYERLAGGTTSPLNERLQVGAWENAPDATLPYIRWSTEDSRAPAQINGADFVTAEGFLVGPEGYSWPEGDVAYDVEMLLTGIGGTIPGMVFNSILPMQGVLSVTGGTIGIEMTSYMEGMGPGNVVLTMTMAEDGPGYEIDSTLTMQNIMMAGMPGPFWQTITAQVDEAAPIFSGDEVAFVASVPGKMTTSDGGEQAVVFALVGTGQKR